MAMYDIKHSCGHVVRANITGPEAKRPARADYLRSIPCDACRAAAKAAEVAAANTDLPALEGTPKQIAWAEALRAKALEGARQEQQAAPFDGLERLLKIPAIKIAEKIGCPVDVVEKIINDAKAIAAAAMQKLKTETNCRWWINNADDIHYWYRDQIRAAEKQLRGEFDRIKNDKGVVETQTPAEAPAIGRETPAEQAAEPVTPEELDGFLIANGEITRRGADADFKIVDAEGRIVRGYVDEGDWVVYLLDERRFSSRLSQAEALAARAKEYFGG